MTGVDDERYEVGDKSAHGIEIKSIFGQSDTVCIFLDENGTYQFEFNCDAEISSFIFAKYFELHDLLPYGLPDDVEADVTKRLLNLVMYATLKTEVEDARQLFVKIEKRIRTLKSPEQLQSLLIASSIFFSVLTFLALYMGYLYKPSDLLLCVSAGVVGSLFSILLRSRGVYIDEYEGATYVYFQSFYVVIAGCISGSFIYFGSHSNLILGFASSDINALLVFTFLGGFSERYIVSLLHSAESKVE